MCAFGGVRHSIAVLRRCPEDHPKVGHGLDSVCSYAKSLSDEAEKSKWLSVRDELMQEFTLIKDIATELASFK
ncbi:hypothetical protein HDU91_004772, partial [Kappamyces sp. JEL0680]